MTRTWYVATLTWAFLATTLPQVAHGLDNGLALTPQMGYNSWYDLECRNVMNETTLRATADKMVELGLPALGYKYLNLDDCYVGSRLPNGSLLPDPKFFPSGMRHLADYVHSKGLLFGLYTARCAFTCDHRPASLDHEVVDAHTFAIDWDADYLKEDSCIGCTNQDPIELYTRMSKALNATGKPVLFDMCWGSTTDIAERVAIGNSWRIGPDDGNWVNIVKNIDIDSQLSAFAGPGHWNNPCLLISRNADGSDMVTETQTRTQFSAYAILAAPLMISGSLLNMSSYTLETYSNQEVIAVSQDALGKQGIRIAGGDLSPYVPGGGSGTMLQPAVLRKCQAGDKAQQWPVDKSLPSGFIQNSAGHCLNVADCDTDVIVLHSCPTSGCCSNCTNMVFTMQNGHLANTEYNGPAQCVQMVSTTDPRLVMGPCNASGALTWQHDPSTSTYSVTMGGETLCLTDDPSATPTPPPSPHNPGLNATNVWARHLTGGRLALFFFNVGPSAIDMTCDVACFQAAGVESSASYTVRDVWAHADIGTMTGATWTVKQVPEDGGSAMLLLTPKGAHQ